MDLTVAAAVFPVVFLGELPDKTMFANLVMASRGRPLAVWLGAASAFAVHVAIAVSVGVAVFDLLPRRAVDAFVAAAFAGAAVYSYFIRNQGAAAPVTAARRSSMGVVTRAAVVIFVAEWGDLTQILTAELAARYHAPFTVAAAALAALCVVAGLAVVAGDRVLGRLSVRTLRLVTAVVLAGLAAYTAVEAAMR